MKAEKAIEMLIDAIENAGDWHKSWDGYITDMPMNFVTKKYYRGTNAFLLGLVAAGFGCSLFATKKQVQSMGGKVNDTATPFPVVLYLPYEKTRTNNKTGEKETKTRFMVKGFSVYNLRDTNIVLPTTEKPKMVRTKYSIARKLVKKYLEEEGITFQVGEPTYNSIHDVIGMPELQRFDNEAEYYNALFHEISHSTMLPKRCNRQHDENGNRIPPTKQEYAQEELIAEISSVLLCMETGVPANIKNSGAYLRAYLREWEKHVHLDALTKGFRQIISAAKKSSAYVLKFRKE